MFEDLEDDRTFVVDSAIKHNLGSKDEIELYEELSIALELMEDSGFSIIESSIKNGINFDIVTPYPDGLPENVGVLFFSVNPKYIVTCQEPELHDVFRKRFNLDTRHFKIKIKKR